MKNIITVSKNLVFALWEVKFLPEDMVEVKIFAGIGTLRREVVSYKMLINLLKQEKEVVILQLSRPEHDVKLLLLTLPLAVTSPHEKTWSESNQKGDNKMLEIIFNPITILTVIAGVIQLAAILAARK